MVRWWVASWIWLFLFVSSQAQDKVHFSLKSDYQGVSAGTAFEVVLRAELVQGWHLYSLTQPPPPVKTTVTVLENSIFQTAGSVTQPTPTIAYDPSFAINTEYFEGQVDFTVPVRVRSSAKLGKERLQVQIRFMVCSDTLCLPPRKKIVETTVQILEPSTQVESSTNDIETDRQGVEAVVQQANGSQMKIPGEARGVFSFSTLAYIAFAMGMGALALLTPCVFPMIPITVSYFTKRQVVGRRRAVRDASLYSLGIVLTFTIIGFGLTFFFGAGGINRLAANPGVNLLIALIFIAFALSLFGALDIRLPANWTTALDRKASSLGGIVGILLMALTFSLVSFTCTVPFVGNLMVVAIQGDWLWAFLGVTSFAVVFSSPFFLLALFPSWLQSLPRSGNWLNSVKITMGFLEVAAALKFISNVDLVYQWGLLTRPIFITIWLAISLVTLFYLLGWFRFPHEDSTSSIGVIRVFTAIFFAFVSIHLMRGLVGFPLGELDAFLPPREYGNSAWSLNSMPGQGEEKLDWIVNYSRALEMARVENKPLFIDFTGFTCTNCRWMEANIFILPQVQKRLREYVLVRLYTDGAGSEHAENMRFEQERFGTIALPFYAILSPDEHVVSTFPGLTRSSEEFIAFLDGGLAKPHVRQKGKLSQSGKLTIISPGRAKS